MRLHRTSVAASGVIVVLGALECPAGILQWQASADNGVTWSSSSLSVPQSSVSVLVRAVVEWQRQGATEVFAGVSFDGTVEGLAGAGAADGIAVIAAPNPIELTPRASLVSVQRIGSLLKLDDPSDTAAPGTGTSWIFAAQRSLFNAPVGYLPSTANPVPVFQYALVLDGSPGSRVISAVANASVVHFYPDWLLPTTRFESVAVEPLTLTVLPAPGAITLLALGGVVAARRRR